MAVIKFKITVDGDLRVWSADANKDDYINVNIGTDIPIEKTSNILVYTQGSFRIERLSGENAGNVLLKRSAGYTTLERDMPFPKHVQGVLKFTAEEDGSRWYCLNRPNHRAVTGETFHLKAGETVNIPADNYIFVATGIADSTTIKNLIAPNLFLTPADEVVTAVTDCMVLRLDK